MKVSGSIIFNIEELPIIWCGSCKKNIKKRGRPSTTLIQGILKTKKDDWQNRQAC